MARPKKETKETEQASVGEVMPESFIQILCALLSNPNYYPKTEYEGVINRAWDILEQCEYDITKVRR